MKIPLKEFEQHIDETILKRGFQYFKKGLVNEPEEIGPGEYEAIVDGTEQYTVQLSIKNDVITEYVCSCPYNFGPVCKHVVAVIFHLQKDELELYKKAKKKTGEGKKTPKKKTVSQQINEILDVISRDSLNDYIKERCSKEKSFRILFLANFAYLVNPESKELYAQQIRAILTTSTDRDGYIGYSGARKVNIAVSELVQRAENQIEVSNYPSAFYMACAVLEEMTKAIQFAEDSNGDIGGSIDSAIDLFYTIVNQCESDELQKEIFNYCLDSFKKEIFKNWDWHFSMLDLATLLAKNPEEAKQIHLLLDNIKASNDDFDIRKTQSIRLALISKMEGEVKATQFLEQNISNPDFRIIAIEAAIEKKEYTVAIAFAEDGIKIDEKKSPGLANDWRDYLLDIYTIQHDTDNIIKYSRFLFLNANREKKVYFRLMKIYIAPENWDNFVGQLIKDIISKNRLTDHSSIMNIYIWEERWDKLFDFVKRNLSLNNLDAYEQYLMKDYANEISDFYQTAILDYVEVNISRGYYQTACRYLRRLIKMGFREKADFVMQQLKTLYPKRKALMEELETV